MTTETQNRALTHDERGKFAPGNNANPGGRPKGLAVAVREATNDGADLVTFLLDVFNGRSTDRRLNTARMRMDACLTLLERGWGRPVSQVEVAAAVGTVNVQPVPLDAERIRDLLAGLAEVMPEPLPEGDSVPVSVQGG